MEKNKDYKNFYDILEMKENCILIVDPFVINLPDLINLKSLIKYRVPIVRVRRPFWGKGNLSEYINKVDVEEVRKALEKLEEKDGLEEYSY